MKTLKKLLQELLLIFLGVILALFFNNVQENRTDRAKINGLLSKIELGTEKNIQSLNMQLNQNQKVMDSLTYYLEDTTLRVGDILELAGGIRYIQFDLAAWNVLKSSELLIDVDYDLTSLLYLLNESIIADASTLNWVNNTVGKEDKEDLISTISDYIVSIKHRLVLSQEIQKLLKEQK
ncbi:MAG: hypothetical protein AAF901_06375 [Bacteroidota bacterium]